MEKPAQPFEKGQPAVSSNDFQADLSRHVQEMMIADKPGVKPQATNADGKPEVDQSVLASVKKPLAEGKPVVVQGDTGDKKAVDGKPMVAENADKKLVAEGKPGVETIDKKPAARLGGEWNQKPTAGSKPEADQSDKTGVKKPEAHGPAISTEPPEYHAAKETFYNADSNKDGRLNREEMDAALANRKFDETQHGYLEQGNRLLRDMGKGYREDIDLNQFIKTNNIYNFSAKK